MVHAPSTIEENTERLAEFERDWAALPLPRTIIFSCRFNGRETADAFARAAHIDGANIVMFEDAFCRSAITVNVVAELPPEAATITEWEHRLYGLLDDFESYYDGWTYPGRMSVNFYPDCSRSNDAAAKARAAILFGTRLVEDPLAKDAVAKARVGILFGRPVDTPLAQPSGLFKTHRAEPFVPSEFLKTAQRNKPTNPHPTVSAFSQWIYSLYGESFGDDEDTQEGLDAEESIWQRRSQAYGSNGNDFLEKSGSPWLLVHNGLHLREKTSHDYFEIDDLRVADRPLKASPDLIYCNRQTGAFVITEIKHSRVKIPTNLWPNIWAQLWCYSKIDLVQQADCVTVVGEIWADTWSKGYGRGHRRVDGQKLISLRASVRRDPRHPKFEAFFKSLFEIYSGTRTK